MLKQASLFESNSPENPDPSSGRCRSNGAMNKLSREDRAVHDWYRFVLSFPPHLVSDYIQRFKLNHRHRVLDPFCGTGTTLVEAKKQGIPSVGIEANPMAHFASSVKLDWTVNPTQLVDHAEQIGASVAAELKSAGIYDEPLLRGLNVVEAPLRGLGGANRKSCS